MASISSLDRSGDLRVRRWDAVVLGSGVSALVAATRLGAAGLRILVVEEEASTRLHPALREPFALTGGRSDALGAEGTLGSGLLDASLRHLNIALIDRRRLQAKPVMYQVVTPELRCDVGEPGLTADELVAWGLAKPDQASAWLESLLAAARAEGEPWQTIPAVQAGRSLVQTLARATPGAGRAGEVDAPPEPVETPWRHWLDAQVRALSNLAEARPEPGERARLVGAAIAGGRSFDDGPPWLHGLLRRRVQAVYGDFRTLSGGFKLVSGDGWPGIAIEGSREVWLGRALVIAAPLSALARVHDPLDRPAFLQRAPSLRRAALHLRVRRDLLPEGMAQRVILVGGPEAPLRGPDHVSVSLHRDPERPGWLDLVARTVCDPEADVDTTLAAVEARIRRLAPFAQAAGAEGWQRRPVARPRWDDDDWLEDPRRSSPGAVDLRLSSRPPVYWLARPHFAALGLEGDLLLGWQGGDAIAGELTGK